MRVPYIFEIIFLILLVFLIGGCISCNNSTETIDGYEIKVKGDEATIVSIPDEAMNSIQYEIPKTIGEYKVTGFGKLNGLYFSFPSISFNKLKYIKIHSEIKSFCAEIKNQVIINSEVDLDSIDFQNSYIEGQIYAIVPNEKTSPKYIKITEENIYEDFVFLKDETVSIIYYIGYEKEITVPNTIDDLPVTKISSIAFRGVEASKIILNDNLTEIGEAAFIYSEIKEIEIPQSVSVINQMAFYGCEKLESASIPSSIKTIPNELFKNCVSLKDVTLEEGIIEIGEDAFSNTGIENINLPDSIESILDNAFSNNKYLKTFVLPKNLTELYCILDKCTNLEKLVINENLRMFSLLSKYSKLISLKEIEINNNTDFVLKDGILYDSNFDCVYLCPRKSLVKELVIDSQVRSYAFTDVQGLEKVTISNAIHNYAFFDCTSLKEVVITDYVDTITEEAFSGCSNLSKINLEKVKIFRRACFYKCSLKNVDLSSAKIIDVSAFYGNKLTEVLLTTEIQNVDYMAFGCNYDLENVTIENKNATIHENAFAETKYFNEVHSFE